MNLSFYAKNILKRIFIILEKNLIIHVYARYNFEGEEYEYES